MVTKEMLSKPCNDCGITRDDSFRKDTALCGACNRARTKKWREADPDRFKAQMDLAYAKRKESGAAREYDLLKKYNMTLLEYRAWCDELGNCCEICSKPSNDGILRVDHDHESGAVRGLLCDTCNRSIGLLKDDPEVLLKAAQYLLDRKNSKKVA